MSINLDLIEKIEKNEKDVLINGIGTCLRLLDNIINNPREEKYRKFKKSNAKIQEMLCIDGLEDLFIDIGFEIADEFVLRRGGLGVIGKLKLYRDFFNKRLDVIKTPKPLPLPSSSTGAIQKVVKRDPVIKIVADKPFSQRIAFPRVLKTSNQFLLQLEQLSDSVMQYEDASLQKSALQIIPVETLTHNAIENMRRYQELIKKKEVTDDEPPLDDFILEELAAWFKNDFFTWINNMDCKVCKGETRGSGSHVDNGVRVEEFTCDKCRVVTNFYRYNDIEKLLVSRVGRCGEFANCFTFLCRCLGYDARYIYSTSDHVWTEVYNHSKKRFIHVDPSENVFDSPLMYEHGWKRKLEYVIAFARDDVQDVTWRYSNQHEELLKRRKMCSETDLMDCLMQLRNNRQLCLSAARKKFCTKRTLEELAELLIIRQPTENERKGRSSGSLTWRLGRGEGGESSNYIFNLSSREIEAKQFNLRYSCAKNNYERFIESLILEEAKDWKKWEFKSNNIFRKIEHDHKMVYLARTEDSEEGSIEWRFDFGNKIIKNINVIFETKTYETGQAKITFRDESENILTSEKALIGASKFCLCVHLSQGKGDCAWQHAQLFRQNSHSDDYPFQIKIQFN